MRKWNTLCLLLLLLTVLTACGQAQGTEQETEQGTKENPGVAETETSAEAAADTITVSTVAELITVIAPDAHIILKSGDYNFSKLTEEEIESCGAYVNPDALSWGEFSVYNAPGLTLEAEKSGPVRLVTEDGYADVMTLTLCDGATLKGLILGHEIEKGVCDADVLQIDTCEDVTVEECVLFGCGANGIWAENADRLTVTKTDIYECTSSIFSLVDTGEAVFDGCRFYDNDGMFFLWGETEALVRDTEIFQNRNPLLEGYPQDVRITFRNCTFRDNPDMGAPEDWPCAVFENCERPAAPAPVSAETAYEGLIQRYRQIVADPDGSSADTAGERCVLTAARDMREWDENPLTTLGYAVEDLSGDGVPELVIGFLPDHSILQYAVYTLVDEQPQVVFEDEKGSLGYLGNGSFHYVVSLTTGMGQGTVSLSQDGAQLLWEDFYFTLDDIFGGGAVAIYHNTTGSLDPAESELTDWTMEYFYAWEPEYENLPMIPFSAAD